MRTAQINTNLFPVIKIGTYESRLNPRYIFDDDMMDQDFEEGFHPYDSAQFWENWDNQRYMEELNSLAKNFILDIDFGVELDIKIEVGEIYSPREYNFATDQVELTVEYNRAEFLAKLKENWAEFGEFLRDNYSSGPGFVSWTPNNCNEWMEGLYNDDPQTIGAGLTFIFRDYLNEWHEEFYEEATTQLRESEHEFSDLDQIYSEAENFEKICTENYLTLDPVIFAKNQDENFENLKFEAMVKIAEKIKKDIDQKTGNLFSGMQNCKN